MAMRSHLIERYPNVNNKIEIRLTQNSEVEELEDASYKLNEPEIVNFELLAKEGSLQSQMSMYINFF